MTGDAIDRLLDAMTLAEQVALLSGASAWETVALPQHGVPAIRVTDGPNGARGSGSLIGGVPSTAFPVGIALGATWNIDLVREIGAAIGVQAQAKGAQVLLAPTVNLQRTAINGRNFECYSEDPHLSAELAVAYVEGAQAQGVAATIKHFVANEIETDRMRVSSVVDERTLRELYLRPFEAAVKRAGVQMVMAAYNRVNGVSASEHRALLTDLLRDEWGFDGVVVSDWYGVYDGVASLLAGVDLEMPGPSIHRDAALVAAVGRGKIDAATIRASAGRMLRLIDRVTGMVPPDTSEHALDRPEDRALIRRAGAEACVLLTNDGILPLDPEKPPLSLAVIGPNAATARIMGGGSSQLHPHHRVAPLDGLREHLGDRATIVHEEGCENTRLRPIITEPVRLDLLAYEGALPAKTRTLDSFEAMWFGDVDRDVAGDGLIARLSATVRVDRGDLYEFGLVSTGVATLSIDDTVLITSDSTQRKGVNYFGQGGDEATTALQLEAGRDYRVMVDFQDNEDDKAIQIHAVRLGMARRLGDTEMDRAVAAAAACDQALLFVGSNEEWDSEGLDRTGIALPGRQDELIRRVAVANPRTVVVLQSGHPVAMPWADDVAAILQAWYPGQECGHAIADVLFGAADPGGRLPQSFFAGDSNYPQVDDPDRPTGHVVYNEGLAIGYRRAAAPRFPFGHGLSYTRFDYGEIALAEATIASGGTVTLSLPVRNIGEVAGQEVVQIYVRDEAASLPRPAIELKGFVKLTLQPGETATANFSLAMRDFAFFDPARRAWVAEAGRFTLIAAASALDHRRQASVELTADWIEPVAAIVAV